MIRAFLFACGTFVTLCGALLFLVDQIMLTDYAGARLRESTKSAVEPEDGKNLAENQGEVPAWRPISPVFNRPRHGVALTEVGGRTVLDPPDWGAVGLLSIGGVTLLYILVVPRRFNEGDEECED